MPATTARAAHVLSPTPSQNLQVLGSTNWKPRMSTGLELQMFLPVVNAPFRIYWAYNPLRLDEQANPPIPITRAHVPGGRGGRLYVSSGGEYVCPEFPVAGAAQDVPLHGGDDVLGCSRANCGCVQRVWFDGPWSARSL